MLGGSLSNEEKKSIRVSERDWQKPVACILSSLRPQITAVNFSACAVILSEHATPEFANLQAIPAEGFKMNDIDNQVFIHLKRR